MPANQPQTELRTVRTGPAGLPADSEAAFRENVRLQRFLQQCDGDGRF
jgi:P pilus assembly chaperone PapD